MQQTIDIKIFENTYCKNGVDIKKMGSYPQLQKKCILL